MATSQQLQTYFHTIKTTLNSHSYIHQKTNISHKPPTHDLTAPRTSSQLNTLSYKKSLSRSFSRAKQIAFFNPDMQYFITLTYSGLTHTPDDVIYHIKQLVKKEKRKGVPYLPARGNLRKHNHELCSVSPCSAYQSVQCGETEHNSQQNQTDQPSSFQTEYSGNKTPSASLPDSISGKNFPGTNFSGTNYSKGNTNEEFSPPAIKGQGRGKLRSTKPKYIWVMEYQKRGSIHVHMIANDFFTFQKNKYGHLEMKHWEHGFSNVKHISGTDNNFKPYLYLFKYMHKSERIGKSFIHTSRTFDKIENIDYTEYIKTLKERDLLFKEDYELYIGNSKKLITKEYLKDNENVRE